MYNIFASNSVKIILAPSWEIAKNINATVSVEAEYGDKVKKGTLLTLAHHSNEYKNNPPVAVHKPKPINSGTILISHIDADTVFACLDLLNLGHNIPDNIRNIIAYIDSQGFHKIKSLKLSKKTLEKIYAIKASIKAPLPKKDKPIDVTNTILSIGSKIFKIIKSHDEDLINQGLSLKEKEDTLEKDSFHSIIGNVIIRISDKFVNFLYTHNNKTYKAVAAFNTKDNSIIISLERPNPFISCKKIVQKLWGPLAGGHDNIAGSPRGLKMSKKDLFIAAYTLNKYISSTTENTK